MQNHKVERNSIFDFMCLKLPVLLLFIGYFFLFGQDLNEVISFGPEDSRVPDYLVRLCVYQIFLLPIGAAFWAILKGKV